MLVDRALSAGVVHAPFLLVGHPHYPTSTIIAIVIFLLVAFAEQKNVAGHTTINATTRGDAHNHQHTRHGIIDDAHYSLAFERE
jgi:hypothetical protein